MQGGQKIDLSAEADRLDYRASDLARDQEGARRRLAYSLIGLLALVVVLLLLGDFAHWIDVDEAKDLALAILSPVVVLAGTAIGFYFGGNNSA